MEDKQNILLINDLVGVGNISATVMIPILAYMGFPTCSLPTSLVSNNFGYGRYAMLDTSEYLRKTFPVWEQEGFGFSAVITGFIPSAAQAELIAGFCRSQAAKGAKIFVDPVMADFGQMYKGLPAETVDYMRGMISVADLCFPNYTEACYLTGTPYKEEGVSASGARMLVDRLRSIGAESVIVTSIKVDGRPAVTGYNASEDKYFTLNYEELPFFFHGTGDIFSSTIVGHLLKGEGLEESTRKAIRLVYDLILLNKDGKDPYMGIPVEKYLYLL